MIRFLFFIIIAAIVLAVASYGFKTVQNAKKITIAGGGIAAAGLAILLQSAMFWGVGVLALVAISLVSSLIYMKYLEKKQAENTRLSEERKEQRQKLVAPAAVENAKLNTKSERDTMQTIVEVKNEDSALEESHPERETVPPTFGMQSIQPLGKEQSRE